MSQAESTTAEHRRLIPTDVPGVYKRGSRYVAITRHKGKRVKTYHRTKAEAKAAKAARDAGDSRPSSREHFDTYARRWVREYRGRTSRGVSERTRTEYAAALEAYAIPYFGRTPLGDVGPLDVRRFIEHLASLEPRRSLKGATRLSPSTVRATLAPVKALLAEAYELELTKTNAGKVRVIVRGERRRKPKAMTREQMGAILAALPPKDRLLFEFLSWTGVRIGEALAATWGDVAQADDGPVFVVQRSKTEAGERSVALVPPLARALIRHRAESPYGAEDDPIFPSMRGTHRDSSNVRKALRKATDAVGLDWVTPHKFRHSLATELQQHGYDATTIAAVLGHTDPAFTARVYIHAKDAPRFDDLAAPVIEAAE